LSVRPMATPARIPPVIEVADQVERNGLFLATQP
jgi:hypothetical protein